MGATIKPVQDRFLGYVRVDTRSQAPQPGQKQVSHPTTDTQSTFIDSLEEEINGMGIPPDQRQRLEDSSLLVHLPATPGKEGAPHVTLCAHVDTYPGCPGGAKPIVHENYNGGDLPLPTGRDGLVIPAKELEMFHGKTIIHTDGTTLLGGDNKAGLAAIMYLIELIMKKSLPHGPLSFLFSVDEEIGHPPAVPKEILDTWDLFITVDGEEVHAVDVGNFNAYQMLLTFKGEQAHASLKGPDLKPAHVAACAFVADLARCRPPWRSTGEEPYFFVGSPPTGGATKSIVKVDLRTFETKDIKGMAETVKRVARGSAAPFDVTVRVSAPEVFYVSTEDALKENNPLVSPFLNLLSREFDEGGYVRRNQRIRGGTVGSMLSINNPQLCCLNIGTGTRNSHKLTEFVVLEETRLIAETVLPKAVALFADMVV